MPGSSTTLPSSGRACYADRSGVRRRLADQAQLRIEAPGGNHARSDRHRCLARIGRGTGGRACSRAGHCARSRAEASRGSRASASACACDLAQPAVIAAAVAPALRELAAAKPDGHADQQRGGRHAGGRRRRLDAGAIAGGDATNAAAPLVLADLFCRTFPTTRSSAGSSTSRPARRRLRSPAARCTACRRQRWRC